jgi:hypothetical protein
LSIVVSSGQSLVCRYHADGNGNVMGLVNTTQPAQVVVGRSSWCRLGKKLWGRDMAISIAIMQRLRTRFGGSFLPVVKVKNELTNAVGLASSYDANGNLTNRVYDATGLKTDVYLYEVKTS